MLYDLILSAIWIRKDAAGNIHVQFELMCGFEQTLDNDVMT
jgi:hypothetical protein